MDTHEIADVFPMLGGTELSVLVADVAANGLRHPIVVFEKKILDGRNRFKACELAGVAPTFEPFDGDWEAAVHLVASENLYRRHLTNTQKAFAADSLAVLAQGRPKKVSADTFSQRQAAQAVGTSRESVLRAHRIRERGVPELVEAAQAEEIGLRYAAELAGLPETQQREAVAGGPARVRQVVREARAVPPPVYTGLPESELAIRRSGAGSHLVAHLIGIVRSVEGAAQQIASAKAAIPAGQTELAVKAVERIRSGADWLMTLITGNGFSDDALTEWLAEGGEE